MKPFVKWVGGKTQLLPQLLERVPKSLGTYYEPFLGGGALFFALKPERAVLSDVNPHLINAYRGVRDRYRAIVSCLLEHEHLHSEEHYYEERAKLNEGSGYERAARFIYLNKACFNGLWRENRKGEMNVPIGRQKSLKICDEDTLNLCSAALNCADTGIYCGDFEIVSNAKPGAFVYFDPPYVPLKPTKSFTTYSAGGFGKTEHERLRDLSMALKSRGVHVMLSNSSAPFVYELYGKDFTIDEVDARRSVNSDGTGRGKVKEVIIT